MESAYLNILFQELNNFIENKANILSRIRNEYTFHHVDDDNMVINQIRILEDDYKIFNNLSAYTANTLFYSSEELLIKGLLAETKCKTIADLYSKMREPLHAFSGFVTTYFIGLHHKIYNKYLIYRI